MFSANFSLVCWLMIPEKLPDYHMTYKSYTADMPDAGFFPNTFQYRLAIKYGLIQESIEPVQFYFEKIGIKID